MEGAMVKQVVAIESIAARARFAWANSRFEPESAPKRHGRHTQIRLANKLMKDAPVEGLVLTWIRRQRRMSGCRFGYSVLVSHGVDLHAVIRRREVPGTRRLRVMAGMGIDLPAALLAIGGRRFGSLSFVRTKIQTNQLLTAHR
jgi:hypothetical protein